MEIKRKLEMSVTTNRRFTIRQPKQGENYTCEECNSAMLTAEQTAVYFGTNQRSIFQYIESDEIHFFETQSNSVMICLESLAKVVKLELSKKLI